MEKKLKTPTKRGYYKRLREELTKLNKDELYNIHNGLYKLYEIGQLYRQETYRNTVQHNTVIDLAMLIYYILESKES